LTAKEAWEVLLHADMPLRAEIFGFFDEDKQVEIIETVDRAEMAELIGNLPPDDRVDLLDEVDSEVVEELMPLRGVDLAVDVPREVTKITLEPQGATLPVTRDGGRLRITVDEFTCHQMVVLHY